MTDEKWVKACVKCRSKRLKLPGFGGVGAFIAIPGTSEVTGAMECLDCGFVGFPIEIKETKNK